MDNQVKNFDEQANKIIMGINKAVEKMLVKSAANNEDVVIGDDYGDYKIITRKRFIKRTN